MHRGRPKQDLVVSSEDLLTLRRWISRRKTARALAMRSQIILDGAAGMTNTAIVKQLRITHNTVRKWRTRFLEQGIGGLLDEPRSGAPRSIGDDAVEAVITKTLESTPRDATHWSTRSMAEASGLSPTTVRRIWKAFELKPHRVETFKLSNDPQFIEKVRDIVGLYLNPPERALVREGPDPSPGPHPAYLSNAPGNARVAHS